jgi:hypothetical protein
MRSRIRILSVLAALAVGAVLGGEASVASAAELVRQDAVAAAPVAASPAPVAVAAARCCHSTIPGNYVYNKDATYQKTLHDYCTKSPDEFSAPGDNANFRGPCARHDLCYQYRQQSRSGCDDQLFRHLENECTYQYAGYDPRREGCTATAEIYYVVVQLNTLWNS